MANILLRIRIKSYIKETIFKKKINYNFNINAVKKSNTLFILGGGASINNISKDELAFIRKSDSFGFNNWIIHDFVPNIYMFEEDRLQMNILYKNMRKRSQDYLKVPILYKTLKPMLPDFKEFPHKLISNLYISTPFEIPGKTNKDVRTSIRHIASIFYLLKKFNIHFQTRASISDIIIYGALGGYENVILCGIDLNTSKYFWEHNLSYYSGKNVIVPFSGQTGTIHSIIDKNVNPISIDDVIYAINDFILKPHGINLYVAFNSSLLYPKIPVFF
jgi:hypothetical protein